MPKISVSDEEEATRRKRFLGKFMADPKIKSWRSVMFAYRHILNQLERKLVAEGCSIPRFMIMFELYMSGSLQAVEIARRLFVTRGNISTFLKRMTDDNLIKPITPEGQKRPVYVLTKEGLKYFEELLPSHIERVKLLVPVLDEETMAKLMKTLNYELA